MSIPPPSFRTRPAQRCRSARPRLPHPPPRPGPAARAACRDNSACGRRPGCRCPAAAQRASPAGTARTPTVARPSFSSADVRVALRPWPRPPGLLGEVRVQLGQPRQEVRQRQTGEVVRHERLHLDVAQFQCASRACAPGSAPCAPRPARPGRCAGRVRCSRVPSPRAPGSENGRPACKPGEQEAQRAAQRALASTSTRSFARISPSVASITGTAEPTVDS